ncbi:MAG: penicillin acylase family protein [Pseudomonadota bacterium]
MVGSVFIWLVRIAGGMIVCIVLAVLAVYYLAGRSLPDYDRTVRVAGISEPVEIVRDNANVPHILAPNDADVFFGLGFAHAQDRLWQMTTLRRTAQGRLSEMFGPSTVEIDALMRRLDLYNLARASVAAQSPRATQALEAYAAGVNARITQINAEALGRGAPEFFMFNRAIAPWTPADSVSVLKLMSVQLSGHLDEEILRARLSLALPEPDMIRDILPDAPGAGLAALPEYAALVPNAPRDVAWAAHTPHALSPFRPRGLSGASNAWAAAPIRSATGGTLLANDPHLGLTAPSVWYLARLELSTGGVIGGTIPGLPIVLSGRSDRLGWGLTTAYVDDQDLFLEEINPDNPEEYRTPGGWAPFQTRRSIITIDGAEPQTITLRWTQNGPVLPGSFKNLRSITPPGHVVAMNWTALSPVDTSVSAGIDIMYAASVAQGIAATEAYISPAQNLTLADAASIAMKTIGAVPRRNPDHASQGRLPSFGYVAANRWQGVMPYVSNPGFVSPLGGILGNTNNKTVQRPFPNHVSFEWGDTQRIQRWSRLMQSRQVHTRDSFIEAQLDTVSFTARSLLPLIGAELWFTGEAAPAGTPARQRQRALALLAEWNGEMNEHLPEPLIYAAWIRALQDRLVRDELGPMADALTHVEPLFIERVFRDVEGAARWCDVRQSAPVERCPDMARLALDDALIWITETFGTELETLRWGDAHQATQDHPVLGEVPILRFFVNIRQSTSGGDNTLQRGRTRGGAGEDAFHNVHAAGYRGVYDFADPDSSVFVISTGQSGHLFSRHYDDLAQLWRRGEYVPMSLDVDLARAAAVGVTVLQPQ